jgi:CRISPR-associated endonuclease/helicase Cas3
VIDQNFDIFQKVIEKQNQNNSNLIIKHHSSTELKYKTSDYEYDDNQSELIIEGWNAEIICTTFVQFFQTLLSNKNSNLRRFHQLNNSIIILDEIQQIPIEYWKLIQNLLLDISKYLNLDIILATATEPSIFEENQIFRLCDSTKYFNNLNRQKYIIELEAKTILEFCDSLEFQEDKSYLFIMNTISAAKDLYKLLDEKLNCKIGFLSTHIIPKQRLKRIKEIKDKKYRVVVSTQLVEAGVDIDFDVVYRDLSPLDSIIQSAGRCNRNN